MGTSTAHPSPRTAEWDYVREAYREGIRDAAEVSRRIVGALSDRTRAEMAGAGPAICLETLLAEPPEMRQAARTPGGGMAPGLSAAAGLRSKAERRIALGGHASLFADIALDALGLSAMSRPEAGSIHRLADLFLGFDLDRCFQYFVSRDICQFVGAEAFPTVTAARTFADLVAEHCKKSTVGTIGADNERDLRAAMGIWDERRRACVVQDILSASLTRCLIAIASPRGTRRAAGGRSVGADAADDEDAGAGGSPLRLVGEEEFDPGLEYLPVYSLQAAAGYFGTGEGVEALGFVPAPSGIRAREGMFVCRIAGRSMEPRLSDGDYAVFRAPVIGSRQGRIVLAQKRGYHDPDTGGSYTVKRYESAKLDTGDSWRHVMIRLVPENPEYEPIEVTAEEAEDLVIIAEFVTVLD